MKPSLREKKRYFLITAKDPETIGKQLYKTFRYLFGIHTAALAGMRIIEQGNDYLIVRVAHHAVAHLHAVCFIMNQFCYTKRVSGTLKRLKEELKSLQETKEKEA